MHLPPSDSSPIIRPLLPRDANALMHLRHQAISECPSSFGTSPKVELSKTPRDYRRRLIHLVSRPSEFLLGMWKEDRLVGMSGLGRRRDEALAHALIYSMYILPEVRREGYGTMLLTYCATKALLDWDIHICRLCVETQNLPALNLYRRNGYEILRREKNAFRLNGTLYAVYHLQRVIPARSPESAP